MLLKSAGTSCRCHSRGMTVRAISIGLVVVFIITIGCSPTKLALKVAKMPVLPFRAIGYTPIACPDTLHGTMAFAGLTTCGTSVDWANGNGTSYLALNKHSTVTVFNALGGLFRDGIGRYASYSKMPAAETDRYTAEIKNKFYVLNNSLDGFIQVVDVSKEVPRIDTLCLKYWEANFPADYYLYLYADIYSISVAMGGGLNITLALTIYVFDKQGEHVFSKRYLAKYRVKPAPEDNALADTCCALFSNLAADQMQAIVADLRCIKTLVPAGKISLAEVNALE